MEYNVILSPKAFKDIDKALDYYAVSPSAILNFNKELNQAYQSLSLNPHFRIRYQNVIGFLLKKFPFILLYKLDETTKSVLIYSVFNTYLNPKKYPKK